MPTTRVDHTESWTIHIERELTDTWPDIELVAGGQFTQMRPDKISVFLHRGADQPEVTIHGRWLAKDGTPGRSLRPSITSVPGRHEWAGEIAERTRQQLGLGPGRTEVPW